MKTLSEQLIEMVSREGFADYVSGRPAVQNPYESTNLRRVWFNGWSQAREGNYPEFRQEERR